MGAGDDVKMVFFVCLFVCLFFLHFLLQFLFQTQLTE